MSTNVKSDEIPTARERASLSETPISQERAIIGETPELAERATPFPREKSPGRD